jgi:predicted phosphodiesterase
VRIALLGDSHGYVPALEAGLAACRAAAPDLTLFLGDALTCPYSPDPAAESIALLHAAGLPAVAGNHDLLLRAHGTPEWEAAMEMRLVRGPSRAARWVEHMAAGKALLAPDDVAWLRTLPADRAVDVGRPGALFASHGLPGNPFLSVDGIDPRETALVDLRAAALDRPDVAAAEIVVVGHNHVPLTTARGVQLVVRAAAAIGWGDQRGQRDRFGGYAVVTRRQRVWEVEHRTFAWQPRDPAWSWESAIERAVLP